MTVAGVAVSAVLVMSWSLTAALPIAQDPPPKFRSAVDVVSVTAVVKDQRGRFVGGLRQEDFEVLEAGKARRVLDFRAETDGPVKLGLLVDASGSMRVGRKAVDAVAAARHLFGALNAKDEAALFSFDTRLDRVSDFTSDLEALEKSLQRLNPPYGQTSLYDAIADASASVAEGARGTQTLAQRTALVVLTDGIDTRSRLTTEQVAAIASRIDVPVYIIAVMAPIDDPSVDATPAFDASRLKQLAVDSGGGMFTVTAPAHASVAARQIVADMRHQYVLAFEASAGAGWRPIEVRSRDRRHIVRARSGYSTGSSNGPGAGPVDSGQDASPFEGCGAL